MSTSRACSLRWSLIGLIVAIGVGVYDAGVTAGLAQTVAAPSGAPVAYYPGPYFWHGAGDSGSSGSSSGSWGSS